VVLNRDGATYHLPGLRERVALSRDSAVVRIARRTLLSGQVYRTFLWPEDDAEGPTTHARMTVLAAIDVPDFVLGTLLVSPHADCCGLTPRELEVLGLVVEGCSNQQIASRLTITIRTVASHLEHILVKLEVPTRTMAAVRAEREGWHVPPATTSDRC
jgi:DNA-binding CsgD family transcriptional regulator